MARTPPALQWIRPPVQGRSQRTLARLLDATEELLAERSFEEVGVQDIVRRADASVGSFYARFESKDAVLHALHERYVAESIATTEGALAPEAWEGVPLGAVVRAMCAFLVAYQREHRGLRRALVRALGDEVFRQRAVGLANGVVERIAALLRARRREHDHRDALRAADFVHRLVFSLLDQHVLFGDDSPTGHPMSDEELVAETTRAIVRYLGVRTEEVP